MACTCPFSGAVPSTTGAPDFSFSVASDVEVTDPETGNLHATLGIEDDNFAGEDNYGLVFLNLPADSAPKVPTGIDSINYDTVFKQSGGKVNSTWVLLDNQSTVIF